MNEQLVEQRARDIANEQLERARYEAFLAEQRLLAAEQQARADGLALNDTLQELVTLRSKIAARQAREQVDQATRVAARGNRHQRRAHKHYK